MAIAAKTKQIIHVVEDNVRRVKWSSEEFKQVDIASITYGDAPVVDINYVVGYVKKDNGSDDGVDCA